LEPIKEFYDNICLEHFCRKTRDKYTCGWEETILKLMLKNMVYIVDGFKLAPDRIL